MSYFQSPRNELRGGLTLLQVNPDCAADLRPDSPDFGWLYTKHPDGQWVTIRKLSPDEIGIAQDQAADMAIIQGTKLREG